MRHHRPWFRIVDDDAIPMGSIDVGFDNHRLKRQNFIYPPQGNFGVVVISIAADDGLPLLCKRRRTVQGHKQAASEPDPGGQLAKTNNYGYCIQHKSN